MAAANLEHLVGRIASDIDATEAAVFSVDRDTSHLTPLLHLRPDNSDAATRAKAVAAFKELVLICVQRGTGGALKIVGSSAAKGTQYCLITLARNADQIIAAAAFITRCRDLGDAQATLVRIEKGTLNF